jgi:formylglycine-generating enzyme required for sulfatase activity
MPVRPPVAPSAAHAVAHPVRTAAAALIAATLAAPSLARADAPSIDAPPVTGAAAAADAAVVISNEKYMEFSPVSYAGRDGDAFEAWLKRTRGVPKVNVLRLRDVTRRAMLDAITRAAGQTRAGGTLWVYYAGHGLGYQRAGRPAAEQVLVGYNAVSKAEELTDAVLAVSEIEAAVASSPAERVVLVLDACFNNAGRDGQSLVDGRWAVPVARPKPSARLTVWSATDANQTAVPYAPAQHGAFTYFAVGALSGWADGVDGARDGQVTLDEASAYVGRALGAVGILGQTPQVSAPAGWLAAKGSLAAEPREDFPSVGTASSSSSSASTASAPLVASPGQTGSNFGFGSGMSAELKSQMCDDDAKSKAEAQQTARLEAEAAKVKSQATAAWRQLVPDLDACLGRDERKACIAAAEQFLAASRSATVTVGDGREVVKTACGERSRVVAGRSAPVSIAEVGQAEQKLAALKVPKGAGGGDWTSPTLGVMKWVPAGSFDMGSPASEAGRNADEVQHRVTLTKGFWMMDHEVTQGEYQAVIGENPATRNAAFEGVSLVDASYPVHSVDWNEAVAYANAVSSRDGLTACYGSGGAVQRGCTGYRLPTEAEWEWAARGGGSTVYAGTSEVGGVCGYANVADASAKRKWSGWSTFGCDDGVVGLSAVKRYRPNGYGLYDMTGNVWEWTQDWYGAYGGAATDPTGAASGSIRVFRGGCWDYGPVSARVAYRNRRAPVYRGDDLGLRLLRSVP